MKKLVLALIVGVMFQGVTFGDNSERIEELTGWHIKNQTAIQTLTEQNIGIEAIVSELVRQDEKEVEKKKSKKKKSKKKKKK